MSILTDEHSAKLYTVIGIEYIVSAASDGFRSTTVQQRQ